MTAAQLQDARMLIPGAYESAPAAAPQEVRAHTTTDLPHVVAASAHPTSRLGYAASMLGDLALAIAVIFAIALAPILAVQGLRAAAALILDTFGRP
jgi:hypothetical protein